jgi:dTDP-4-dehydrorhamnose reductase
MQKLVAITGISGQLGGALIATIADYPTVGWSRQEFDLENPDQCCAMIMRERPELLFHCAAYTQVEQAEEEPERAMLINAEATKRIAEACKKVGTRLVYISTDYVFDGEKRRPYLETDECRPLNVYGQSKWLGEQHVVASGCDYTVVRASWIYDFSGKNFFTTMLRLSAVKKEIDVVDDQTGSPTYAGRLAEDLWNTLSPSAWKKKPIPGTYHYSPTGQTTWYGFARRIFERMSIPTEAVPVSSEQFVQKAHRPEYSKMNAGKWEKAVGAKIAGWEEQLDQCIQQWKQAK